MKLQQIYARSVLLAIVLVLAAATAHAYVPVRISIKFILDANGNRPATGNLNTDAEINAEFDAGIDILRNVLSEFRIYRTELVDLSGVSQYYSAAANSTNRDNLRADAISNPTAYLWRTNAINVYINGGTSSAISKFPPDNDIILMNQWCGNTPSCILHEIGHSLNLLHTHEGGGADGCADTISDNSSWTRDDIALNNFGCVYAACTAAQQDKVDLVFNNVMSYHISEPQLRLSPCQMDRISTQGDSDRSWLLAKTPVYVNSGYTGLFQFGRFTAPYKTLQAAVDAGLAGKVLVLQNGYYTVSTAISDNTTIVTRSAPSTIDRGVLLYSLPVDLEKSAVPEVRRAVKAVQLEDKAARQVIKAAKQAAEGAATAAERASILADAEARKKQHEANAIQQLLNAVKFAGGKEKIAIQLELAQRYRDSGNYAEAVRFFSIVADSTKQEHLRERALYEANRAQERLDALQQQAAPSEQE